MSQDKGKNESRAPRREKLFADPTGVFVQDVLLQACQRFANRTFLIDTSCVEPRHISYGDFGALAESAARGLVASGLQPGERVGIHLFNSWEYVVAYYAVTLAGAIPTPLNPSYREREIRHQLENSGASVLITDGPLIADVNLSGLPALRQVYAARDAASTGAGSFADLFHQNNSVLIPSLREPSDSAIAALPYSSGTTGLPKGVMLTHHNLVTNNYQLLGADGAPFSDGEIILCSLPLYHIYGLNVLLNPALSLGATLVLLPRFDVSKACRSIQEFGITFLPVVPPMLKSLCEACEQDVFPRENRVRWVKSGAASLSAELAQRFTSATSIRVAQGYGMTECSPVVFLGSWEDRWFHPDSIGTPVALTECQLIDEHGTEVPNGEIGEIVVRGPQVMLGYWNTPDATAEVLSSSTEKNFSANTPTPGAKDLWYRTGDLGRQDKNGFYFVVGRLKELIKFKGFSVAPGEVESVLLEHPAVRDCCVVGRPDAVAGEIPCAFVVLRNGFTAEPRIATELCGYVAERLAAYKQPRDVHFVESLPYSPSGKILRRVLRESI
jgi:long-chain acyl-CoA synthetase